MPEFDSEFPGLVVLLVDLWRSYKCVQLEVESDKKLELAAFHRVLPWFNADNQVVK